MVQGNAHHLTYIVSKHIICNTRVISDVVKIKTLN